MSKKRLVALSGSLRKGSYNTALLHNATDLLGDRAEVRILDIRMPLYDPDLEDAEFAASLAATKAAITDADGVIIGSPEYNFSVPGPLKNAIDWLSKPMPSPFDKKPVLFLGASPGAIGTARAKMHLRDIFAGQGAFVHNGPEFNLARAHQAIDGDGRITDEGTRKFLDGCLGGFLEFIDRVG